MFKVRRIFDVALLPEVQHILYCKYRYDFNHVCIARRLSRVIDNREAKARVPFTRSVRTTAFDSASIGGVPAAWTWYLVVHVVHQSLKKTWAS
jgi:hypothetical protein